MFKGDADGPRGYPGRRGGPQEPAGTPLSGMLLGYGATVLILIGAALA
ncbi:hypothetical protein [Rhodovastum atsumiense]|nr:hypothetical protein [Rhodovastum atsumiense]